MCASAPVRSGDVHTLNPDLKPRNESREPGILITLNPDAGSMGGDEEVQGGEKQRNLKGGNKDVLASGQNSVVVKLSCRSTCQLENPA